MFFAADDADGFKTKMVAGCGRCVDMIRPGTAKSQQGIKLVFFGINKVVFQLAPLIAAKLRVNKIITFNKNPDTGLLEKCAL